MRVMKETKLTIYKSSAGAGKTYTLVENYIDRLFSIDGNNAHRRILAVTFTKKATAEMKARIINDLSKLAKGEKSPYADSLKEKYKLNDEQLKERTKKILIDLLQDYNFFQVSTIDSFFQQIIRSFARELGLSGAYNLEIDGNQIMHRAVDDYFFNIPNDIKDPRVKALLDVINKNIDEGKNWNPKEKIYTLSKELLKEKFQINQHRIEEALADPNKLTNYKKQLLELQEKFFADCEGVRIRLQNILNENGVNTSDFKNTVMNPFFYKESMILDKFSAGKITNDFSNFLDDYSAAVRRVRGGQDERLLGVAAQFQPLAVELSHLILGNRAKDVVTARVILKYLSYLSILKEISQCVRDANEEFNRLSISDTTTFLNQIISQSDTPFIYDKIGTRILHYMIDEFQDTSTMQWENFKPLISESMDQGGENMLVGDVKQSIYRFRNSDSNLLGSQVVDKDYNGRCDLLNLPKNWRSNKAIVETNNLIFNSLAKEMQNECNNKTGLSSTKITDIYNNSAQEIHNTDDGYVQIQFVENKGKLDRVNLDHIISYLDDVFQRGIQPCDVAILVRENKDARAVTDFLLAKGINVMSNEGMTITAAAEVRVILDMLRCVVEPENKVARFYLQYDYAISMGKSVDEAICLASRNEVKIDEVESKDSLKEYVTAIIGTLDLYKNEAARPYVLAFEDKVYQYETKFAADIYSFLTWWDEVGNKGTVPLQAASDAVQVMSIHASKGLEFDVVIIPFFDWERANKGGTIENILWVNNPNNEVCILPVNHSSDLSKSDFADDYKEELQDLYIDNLNIAYVAFTRAVKELYVVAPTEDGKVGNMGSKLYSVLSGNNKLDENKMYHKGEKVINNKEKNTSDNNALGYRNTSEEHKVDLNIKLPSRDYFSDETDISKIVNLGIIMHEVLCNVKTKNDEQRVLDELLMSGRVTKDEYEIIKREIEQWHNVIKDRDWFDESWQVLNEQDIILKDGTTRRPDRLMIKGNEAVIVDWKFGRKETNKHIEQVQEYINLLQSMGYKAKGYLCYITLRKIVEVENH